MLLSLPNELLLEVLHHLPNTSDMYSLLLTTKELGGFVQPLLDKAAKEIEQTAKEKNIPLIHLAASKNDCRIGKLALKLDPGCIGTLNSEAETALHIAAESGYGKILRFLLSKGADPNAINIRGDAPLDLVLENEYFPVWLCEISDRHEEAAQQLVVAGADPSKQNRNGDNSFIKVATGGLPRLMTTILDCGRVDINSRNRMGETVLHLAAWIQEPGAAAVVELLLKRGINPNAIDPRGKTALFFSSTPEITALLVRYGTDINLTDYKGQTILHKRAKSSNQQSAYPHMKQLLKTKIVINLDHRDNIGCTALDYARSTNNVLVVRLLEKYMYDNR